MEAFDEPGVFWLPGQDDEPRPGQLRFEHGQGGLHLTLFNTFEHPFTFMSAVMNHPGYPVLLGHLHSGEQVTLTDALVVNTNFAMSGTLSIRVELACRYIFRGALLPDGAATEFDRFRIRYEHLEEWAFQGPPLVSEVGDDQRVIFTAGDIADVEFSAFGGRLSISYETPQQVEKLVAKFENYSEVTFEADAPRTVPELTATVTRPLQYLLTFSCGIPLYVTSFFVQVEGMGRQLDEMLLPTWIDVAYAGWTAPADKPMPMSPRLLLRTIQSRIEEFVNRWADLYRQQERAIVRLFAITLGLDLYLDTRFLFAVQALELYHRSKWPEGVLPKEEQKLRVGSISDLVSDTDLRNWLKGKLAHSNEPTLRQRIEKMIEFAGAETSEFLRSDFAKASADTRNYLTHYDPEGKDKAADGEDLWVLSTEVMALMEFCLMRELGFDGPTSYALCAPTSTFQSLLQRQGKMSPVHISTTLTEPPDSNEPTA